MIRTNYLKKVLQVQRDTLETLEGKTINFGLKTAQLGLFLTQNHGGPEVLII